MDETIMTRGGEQNSMNDAEQRQKKLKKRRVFRWGMMVLGILILSASIRYPLLFSYPLTTLVALGLMSGSGCWMLYRFLSGRPLTHMGSSTDEQADPTQQPATQKSNGGKQSLMLILLLIGLVTAGVGMGMDNTTPVEKQICIEEDYSGDCVEWSEGSMQVTEQNQTKPIAIAGGFIIGLIGLVGIIIVE